MDWLGSVVEAADTWHGIVVVFLIGLFAFLWKHGDHFLSAIEGRKEKPDDADAAE